MSLNVANLLTLSRLVLTPFFIYYFWMGHFATAFIIFCVAGFTDLIDGTVARLLRQPSKGGALLDPIADKLLVQSSFCLLALKGIIPVWFFGLSLLRDMTIVGGIIYLTHIKAELPYRPLWSSKLTTLFQLTVAVLALIMWWKMDFLIAGVLKYVVLIAAVFIVISGFQYIKMGIKILNGRH